ncbi:MAG: VanZ family protein [Candidatus Omnitrophica bacterium]|nr:VanZ family protein [Candidatus Omnitrophota bacterium]
MTKKERILRYWLVFYFYMLCIFIGSSIPGENLIPLKRGMSDIVLHFFEYLVFGILCMRALKASYPAFKPSSLFILAVLFSSTFAFSDEIHQHFVFGRFLEVKDLISDGVGFVFGILLYKRMKKFSWVK